MKFKVSINCISLAENLDHLTFRSFLIFSFLLSNALFPSATKIFELQPLLLRVALGRPAAFHLRRPASSMIELSHMCRSIKPFGMDYFFCTRFLFWFFNFFFGSFYCNHQHPHRTPPTILLLNASMCIYHLQLPLSPLPTSPYLPCVQCLCLSIVTQCQPNSNQK